MTSRREWMVRSLGHLTLPLAGMLCVRAGAQGEEAQLVKVTAQRFHYTPSEVRVKAGRAVVIEFTSVDFVHGFHLPDMNVRADLLPGTVTRVRIPAMRPGRYEFLCDNFCGDGHETMHGMLVVDA